MWNYIFYHELCTLPEEHSVVLVNGSMNVQYKNKAQEILFETFSVPAMHIEHQPTAALFSCGLVSGTVISAGGGITSSSPIYESTFFFCVLLNNTCRSFYEQRIGK